MYMTQQDVARMRIAAGSAMSEGEILRDLLDLYRSSPEYKAAIDGDRYLKVRQDIYKHDFRIEMVTESVPQQDGTTRDEWRPFSNLNRSNHRAANGFFREQVVQKTSYILGKEPSISVAGESDSEELKAYREALSKTTDVRFCKAIKQLTTRAACNGKAWLHEYMDADGALRQTVVGRANALPIYDTERDETLQEMIYFYTVQVRLGRGEPRERTAAEWWTASGVTYWYADDDGVFQQDPDRRGVQPHYWRITRQSAPDGMTMCEVARKGMAFERFPWIELANNEDGMSDLEPVKCLIDAYDLVQNTGTNNLLDFNEFFAIIQGFGGDRAAEIVRKLRVNHAVYVGSAASNGNIEMKQLSLDMQGRIDWLKVLRDAIYEFGMAVDIKSAENLGSAPSGLSLKFQYTLLDLKANDTIAELSTALQMHFWFATQQINRQLGTEYDAELVEVSFNKSMIVNDTEIVDIITKSEDLVPERTLLAAHPLVTDPDAALVELEKQRKKKAKAAAAAFGKYGGGEEDDEP